MASDQSTEQASTTGGLGGIGDKLSDSASTGGIVGQAQEYVGKGIETLQKSVMGQGGNGTQEAGGGVQQVHEEVDQMHPEKVSELLRDKYKSSSLTKGGGESGGEGKTDG
ncbi:hypothetical protein MMC21_004106 [Puttea exsequens]|nr:hypothetical protein [Puttea exsequens]